MAIFPKSRRVNFIVPRSRWWYDPVTPRLNCVIVTRSPGDCNRDGHLRWPYDRAGCITTMRNLRRDYEVFRDEFNPAEA